MNTLGAWRVPTVVETEEYHGQTYQVRHRANPPVQHLGPKWCELCDVVIAVYHPADPYARITFLQAKYQRPGIATAGIPLDANLVQWSLLANRAPIIGYRNSFHPPPPADLLSSAATPSIASFGFFFERQSTLFDMAYVSAVALTARPPPRSRTTKSGKVSFAQASLCSVRVVNGYHEIVATRDLVCFGAALIFRLVGSPIVPGSALAGWVDRFVAQLARRNGQTQMLTELAAKVRGEGYVADPGDDTHGERGQHPHIVIVKSSLTGGEQPFNPPA